MIERPIPLPTNRHITALRDRKWPMAFALLGMVSLGLGLTLALIGWPRLQSVSLHYDLVRLRGEVERLEYQTRELEARLGQLRAPEALGRQASILGLTPPTLSVDKADSEVQP